MIERLQALYCHQVDGPYSYLLSQVLTIWCNTTASTWMHAWYRHRTRTCARNRP